MKKITVNENEAGQRLDKLLLKYLNKASKGFIYKMLRKKNITLNSKKTDGSQILKTGDEITLFLSDETIEKFMEEKVPDISEHISDKQRLTAANILYQDDHVILINKPAGLLSQKSREQDISLVELLIDYLLKNEVITRESLKSFRPAICNRLDRNTSGIVIGGKSLLGLQEMSRVLKEREIHKYYLCVVKGQLHQKQNIKGFLLKDEKTNKVKILKQPVSDSQPIETAYEPLMVGTNFTLLKVNLLTGRTHQIRSHLASIGHPIAGDSKYGDKQVNEYLKKHYRIRFQLLHSAFLVYPEMVGKLAHLSDQTFSAPLPEYFQKVLKAEGIWRKEEELWAHGTPED